MRISVHKKVCEINHAFRGSIGRPKFHADVLGEAAKIVGPDFARQIEKLSLQVYNEASIYAAERGMIIADTKFEFGVDESTTPPSLVLVDEVLTPDSSRFWSANKFEVGKGQESFDKQYLRGRCASLNNWTDPDPRNRLACPNFPKGQRRCRNAGRHNRKHFKAVQGRISDLGWQSLGARMKMQSTVFAARWIDTRVDLPILGHQHLTTWSQGCIKSDH